MIESVKLYVVHGSHPCACVEKALDMKGFDYKVVELPPAMHAPIQRLIFGKRTVPGLKLDDGEKISGSRAIIQRLEALRPDPPLYPSDPAARAKVEEAEHWGDEVFQPVGRRLLWPAMKRSPKSIPSYAEHSKLPLPAFMAVASAPLIARAELRLNEASDATLAADLVELPNQLDRIDGYIADGVIGSEPPNAADLQIAPTVRLLLTIDDLKPMIDGRPAGTLARRLFPEYDGCIPAGTLPVAA